MKKLQMPSSYAVLTAKEQQELCGGSEFKDSVDSFFGNLHMDDFFFGGDLVSFSVTFVPMLLFRMVKLGVQTGITIYQELTRLMGLTTKAASNTAQMLSNEQQRVQSFRLS